MKEELVGKITHYFTNIGVAVIEITKGDIKVGDQIHVKGTTSDFEQKIESLQIEHESVEKAKKGQSAGLKTDQQAREGDEVYKIEE